MSTTSTTATTATTAATAATATASASTATGTTAATTNQESPVLGSTAPSTYDPDSDLESVNYEQALRIKELEEKNSFLSSDLRRTLVQLNFARSAIENKNEEIKGWKAKCEELIVACLDEDTTTKLNWLADALFLQKASELVLPDKVSEVGHLLKMTDKEMETLQHDVFSFTYMRYALRKKESGKEGQVLFKLIKGRDAHGSEIKGFMKEVRSGELLLKLNQAYNQKVGIQDLDKLLQSPLAIQAEDLKTFEFWITFNFKSSSIDKNVNQELMRKKGVPARVWQILDNLAVSQSPKRKRSEGGSNEGAKRTKK